MTEPTPPKRRRRWFSISVRSLMLLVLVAGGGLGWKARRACLQRRAVAKIESLHGSVRYDWQPNLINLIAPAPAPAPPGPVWLRRILGDEYFQEVVEVTLPEIRKTPRPRFVRSGADPNDPVNKAIAEEHRRVEENREALDRDQLACLEGLDRIEALTLWSDVHLKSAGLERLGRLNSLEDLTLSYPLDDEGLAQVAKLTQLEDFSVAFKLRDESNLSLLERLPKLKRLSIRHRMLRLARFGLGLPEIEARLPSVITDQWMIRLCRLTTLTRLSVSGSEISDAGLVDLKRLQQLEDLSLQDSPRITDAGLQHLKSNLALRNLDIDKASEISDAGIVELSCLKNLEQLELASATKVTDSGLATLAGLDKLELIDLTSASGITDAGLPLLNKLTGLYSLRLNVHSLTDLGLKDLQTMTNLIMLELPGAKIKGEILDQIQAAIPGIVIQADRIDEEAAPEVPAPATPPPGRTPLDLTPPAADPRS